MATHAVLDRYTSPRTRILMLILIVLAALLIWPSRAGGLPF